MPKARLYHDKPHARVYEEWFILPAWLALPNLAMLLFIYMLAENRDERNGKLEWPISRVAKVLKCSRTTAAECLTALEKYGWIEVMRVGTFCGARKPSLYRVTNFKCLLNGTPASHAYRHIKAPPHQVRKRQRTGFNSDTSRIQHVPGPSLSVTKQEASPVLETWEDAPQDTNEIKPYSASAAMPENPQERALSQILLRDAPRTRPRAARWEPEKEPTTTELSESLPLFALLPDQRH